MPRGALPNYKQRLEPILDNYLMKSIELSNGAYHPETGFYSILTIEGAASRDSAQDIVRALYRSKYHLNKKLNPKIGLYNKVSKNKAGTYDVEFAAVHLSYAKKYITDEYSEDASKWPYNPRAKAEK